MARRAIYCIAQAHASHTPFYHLGAVGFVVIGVGYFIAAVLQENFLAVHFGVLVASMGSGVWLGLRMRDFRARKG